MSHLVKPFIALILGIVPFFLFIGTTSTTTLNGEVAAETSFNFAGIVLALIGIGLAWRLMSGSGVLAQKILAALAMLICVLQLISSSGIWRIEPLDWLIPDRHLPAPGYSSLTDADRIFLVPESEENYRNTMAHHKGEIIRDARLHNSYAATCHGGRSRVDLARAEALPDVFDADLQERLAAGVARFTAQTPESCTERNSIRIMATLADETNRRMDLFDRLVEDYRGFTAGAAVP